MFLVQKSAQYSGDWVPTVAHSDTEKSLAGPRSPNRVAASELSGLILKPASSRAACMASWVVSRRWLPSVVAIGTSATVPSFSQNPSPFLAHPAPVISSSTLSRSRL